MFTRNIMDSQIRFLRPDQTIAQAVRAFEQEGKAGGKKIFGMMVIDEQDRLCGMLSMYDILRYIRPKHIGILGQMGDLSYEPVFAGMRDRVRQVRVADLMTGDLVFVTPDTHVLVTVDLMVKKHIRRLPVVAENRVVGILYRSDVFHFLMGQLAGETEGGQAEVDDGGL